MYDPLRVEVGHSVGDVPGPPDHQLRGQLGRRVYVSVKVSIGAEVHEDAVARRLGTHTPVQNG